MKNTIGELIDRVQTLYSKGVSSDDVRLEKRVVYHKLVSSRNKLVAQQVKKRQKVSDWNYVVLPCIELIQVESHKCPCIPAKGCKVYRTKHVLPKILTDLNTHLIDWVMSIDNIRVINPTTREGYLYVNGSKYTAKNLRYILEEGHLFVYGEKIPQFITAKILPEDPIDAYMYTNACECTDCDDCGSITDMLFPIDGDLVDTLIEMTIQELDFFIRGGQEDQSNNAADTIREQSK